MHMDPNIGKRLNALGNTLTTLTGEEDIDDITDLNSENMADLSDEDESDGMSPTIHMVSALFQIDVVLLQLEVSLRVIAEVYYCKRNTPVFSFFNPNLVL